MIIENVMLANESTQKVGIYKRVVRRLDRKGIKLMDAETRKNFGQSKFSDDIKKQFGTIFTPPFVVQKTVDLAWKYIPEGVNQLDLTYCDPACGDGNFLEYVYEKLMEETSIVDPIQRSYHILTKCLWGFEILEVMMRHAKIRLWGLHRRVCERTGDTSTMRNLINELNIYHGNTICLPADTEQEWYKNRQSSEGGLLSAELRGQMFDVIVGNPPYTHLRNMENRRYAAYPKQRDMAQVFVRWALDHLTETGVCGYNATDKWLDIKICDGALETRHLLHHNIFEIISNEAIKRYSEGDGGNIQTIVFAFGRQSRPLILNGQPVDVDINTAGWLSSAQLNDPAYKWVRAESCCGPLNSQSGLRNIASKWGELTCFLSGKGNYYIAFKRAVGGRSHRPAFKLVQTDDMTTFMSYYDSELKWCQASREHSLCLFGWLNSTSSIPVIRGTFKSGGDGENGKTWLVKISGETWKRMQVPDFDFYKQDRPERFQAYMSWIEANMQDKDSFLAGIDEQFAILIGE